MTPGALAGICSCGHTFYREFPALGHAFTEEVTVEPTCTEDGYTGMKCIRCDEVYERNHALVNPIVNLPDKTVLPATGHSYGTPTYEWSENHDSCTAKTVCQHDDSHVITENGTVSSKTEGSFTVYTASFVNELFTVQTVKVKNESISTAVIGDLNGDGNVNLKDVTILRRYIAGGWDVAADINAADLNGDGNVNLKDVTILRRYIAGGWNVEINSNNP